MRLIVNADDFGFSKHANDAIILCHQKGIVTSTTLLAGSEAFDEAITLAGQNPNLAIGIHLAIDGALNIGKEYKTLLDPTSGRFYDDVRIVKRIIKGKLNHAELVEEYSLQIEKVLNTGISVSHLDHHHHLHLYFPILRAVLEVAKKYDIPFIRSQKILFQENSNPFKRAYRLLHHFYLTQMHRTLDGYVCIYQCEGDDMDKKLRQIMKSDKKIIELVVHPSVENGEIEFLTDLRTIKAVERNLISFTDIAQNVRNTERTLKMS